MFLDGLKEDLKVDLRIQKPYMVYKATLKFECKLGLSPNRSNKSSMHQKSYKPNIVNAIKRIKEEFGVTQLLTTNTSNSGQS